MLLNANEQQIGERIADAVMHVLNLEAVHIVASLGPDNIVTVTRAAPGSKVDVAKLLRETFQAPGTNAVARELLPDTRLRGFSVGIGLTEGARLYAAASREDFPTHAEQLELVMVANHAAVAWKRASVERALRQSEAELRDLNATLSIRVEEQSRERDRIWHNSRDLHIVCDAEGTFLSVNPAWELILGKPSEEAIGRNFLEFIWPDDISDTQKALEIAAAGTPLTNFQNRYRHKDGTPRWLSWHTSSEGKLIYCYGRDVTAEVERERAAETLRRSEEEFRLLVQGVTDYAIYLLNPKGIITNWNAGAERIKGYQANEVIGSHFSRFYSAEDAAAGLPQLGLETALREGRFEKEGWRYRKDGSRFWANVVIDPIRDPNGTLIGFAKITRDVTERKEAQATIERAREAMAQSQKMDAIGQLTGGVAHDFNNLLMAVLGSLELIRKRIPEDAKLKMLLNNAFEGARRGVSLTQRMLSFARRQELKLTSVSVSDLVSGMSDLLARTLGPLITVQTDIAPSLPGVKADPNQLETALLNLAVNARDAMPHGGVITIAGRLAKTDEVMGSKALTENCVVLSVTDTGEGMDETTLARALEPFYTTKGVGKGTGLGLSMVHGMAEQLGGRVRLQSQVGQGTNVELWLPTAEGITSIDPVPSVPAAAPEKLNAHVIVVVDDDRLVLTNTTAMLEDFGHTVLEASSGAQALEVIRKTPHVDLVVTDQAMPQMTGIQLAAAVKVEWPDLPVLLVSGYAELPLDATRSIPKLAKPFSLDDLERAVSDLIVGSKKGGEHLVSSYRE
jgi:PAS domain S-box-containing protein